MVLCSSHYDDKIDEFSDLPKYDAEKRLPLELPVENDNLMN